MFPARPACVTATGQRHTAGVTDADAGWEQRNADLWAAMDDHNEANFLAEVEKLAAELAPDSAIGLFERASAHDSTGQPERAVELYTAALDAGLGAERRRRAVIQLSSSLRNLGRADDAVALLTAEMEAETNALDVAVQAFLALALADVGREREAVGVALMALSDHLPRYSRSVANYSQEFTAKSQQSQPG